MVELYNSKQKGVWEQITLKMIEIIEKHSLAYTNVNTYQKNKSLAAVSTTFPISGCRWCNPNTRACSQAKQTVVRCLTSDHRMQVTNFLLLCLVGNIIHRQYLHTTKFIYLRLINQAWHTGWGLQWFHMENHVTHTHIHTSCNKNKI